MIRARLAELWPVLSKEFGLMPWDVGRLSPREIRNYEASARHIVAEARKAQQASRR